MTPAEGGGEAFWEVLRGSYSGGITAASEGRDKGASFIVTFPEVKADASTDPAPLLSLTGTPLTGIQLLLIDDDADWRQLLSLALEGLGASVLTVESVADGVALLQSTARRPDVILADIGMPREDGYAFVDALRNLNGNLASVPVIALTAYAGPENESRALAAGFSLHCAKPLEPDAVARAVLKLIR